MGLDKMSRKVHPTAQVEVTDGTVGEFVTNYLDKNGRRIQIIGQLSVNDSAQFLGVPDQVGGVDCRLFATCGIASRPQGE